MFDRDTTRVGKKRSSIAFLLVAVVALLGSAFVATAFATVTKPYSVDITPMSVGAGTSTSFGVTIHNESTTLLRSANVTAPSNFTVTAATPAANATLNGNTVELRNLAIAGGADASFTITATAPCAAATSAWGATARTTADYSGPSSNNFTLNAGDSTLGSAVTGVCHLNFVTQPADAEKTKTIFDTPFNSPAGNPVQVEVAATDNARVTVGTASTALIAVAISPTSPDPEPGAILSGTATKNAAAGLASFNNLSIDLHGTYNLRATNALLTAATSAPQPTGSFIIWDKAQACNGNQNCTSSVGDKNSFEAAFSGKSSSAGFLMVSVGQEDVTCGDSYNHAPFTTLATTYQFNATANKTMVGTIDKKFVQAEPDNGASKYKVCFESDDTTFTYPGGVVKPMGTPFILPDCKAVKDVAPCLVKVKKVGSGDVEETISLPKDDAFRYR